VIWILLAGMAITGIFVLAVYFINKYVKFTIDLESKKNKY